MEMAEGLPEGLVRNREGVTAVGEGIDRVEADLVATCWRRKFHRQLLAISLPHS